MKSLAMTAALLAGLVSLACPANEPGIPLEEEFGAELPIELLSSVNVADPRAEEQLVRGFHGLEQRAWRWTQQEFVVRLQPPPPVAGVAYALDARLTIPGVALERLGPIAVSAEIAGVDLESQVFPEAEENVLYTREIPPGAIQGDEPVDVVFRLDKAMAAGEIDSRELGIVALSFRLR